MILQKYKNYLYLCNFKSMRLFFCMKRFLSILLTGLLVCATSCVNKNNDTTMSNIDETIVVSVINDDLPKLKAVVNELLTNYQ